MLLQRGLNQDQCSACDQNALKWKLIHTHPTVIGPFVKDVE
jgi:hypothetical protein